MYPTGHVPVNFQLTSGQPLKKQTSRFQTRKLFKGYMPTKFQCNALVSAYIKGYHPQVPVIHIPTFLRKYESSWGGETINPSLHSESFLALTLAVCFAGALACPHAILVSSFGPSATREFIAANLRTSSIKALRTASFPRTPTLESLTAYIICQASVMRGLFRLKVLSMLFKMH